MVNEDSNSNSKVRAAEKESITASSLSRIMKHSQECESGTISAFRPKYSQKENMNRHRLLGALLVREYGFNTMTVMGIWKDPTTGETVKESSYFVWDPKSSGRLLNALLKLGDKFEQCSITYAPAGEDYKEYAANKESSGNNTGAVMATFKGTAFGSTGQAYSKIRGRPFMWANRQDYKQTGEGKIEACYRVKCAVNYHQLRYNHIEKMENSIGKISATDIIKKAKADNGILWKFITGEEAVRKIYEQKRRVNGVLIW